MEEEQRLNIKKEKETWIDVDQFDVVLLGTNFIESILAGALARAGKSVLHLDKNSFYGGFDSSFTLSQLATLLEESKDVKDPIPPYLSNVIVTDNSKIFEEEERLEQERKDKEEQEEQERKRLEQEKEKQTEQQDTKDDETKGGEGEESKGEEQQQEQTPIVKKPIKKTLHELGRFFSIDLAPTLLYSRGSMVNLLISSSASKYLEFKSLDQNYLYAKNTLYNIPSTKGSIFKDSTFSLREKRLIMKFIETIRELTQPTENEQDKQEQEKKLEELNSKHDGNFLKLVKSFGMTELVESFVLYGLSLIHENLESISLKQGVESVQLYVSSLLVYGTSPFLVPYYGCGDIPQAFCRLCAVYGGTYVLQRSVESLSFDENNILQGIKCTEGQPIKTKYFIASPAYVKTLDTQNTYPTITKRYSRFIGITNKKLNNTLEQSFITLPPNTCSNKNVINILQLDSICVPYLKGKTLYHFTTLSEGESTAEEDLKSSVDNFFANNTQEATSTDKPRLEWSSYFNFTFETLTNDIKEKNVLNKDGGVLVCSDSPIGSTIDYASQLEEAKKLFEYICPNEIFLEKVPEPEDIVWGEAQ
ncbi:hypothetical protein CYY_004194 [Polysphondylium violaceum]|uniref:Rab escort protein 1 n=1 Tax=Polysphondylium violaceum TaxID=133409 RepID=A0A8J4V7Z5_9MYCE|nr:hypothetical protein CYY_004194 [Polysphondylium violaceum]